MAHVPVGYDIYGQQVPYGKGTGLKRPSGSIKTLNGKVKEPKDWRREPKHRSKSHLMRTRKHTRSLETMKDLTRTETALNKTLYDRKHISSYSKVMAGSSALPVTSPTRSALFSKRHNDHIKSMKTKARQFDRMQREDPNNKAVMESMKTFKKSWFTGRPSIDAIEGPIAKGVFHPPQLNDPGLAWVNSPKFNTGAKLRKDFQRKEKETGVQRMKESWAIMENSLKKAVAKDAERRRQMGLHSPKTKNKQALLRNRKREMSKKIRAMQELNMTLKKEQINSILDEPQVSVGWWKKGKEHTYKARGKPMLVKAREDKLRNTLVENGPFKRRETSMHTINKKKKGLSSTSTKPNEIDRFKEGHKQHVMSRSKPPPKALKRWSDVAIEFKEVQKKRERKALAKLNGEECGDDSEDEYYNPLDDAPMYSSFSKTLQFVEPVYGIIHRKEEKEDWPSIVLRPMSRSASGRKLTCMDKMQRMRRFRKEQAQIRRNEEAEAQARIDLSMKRSSSFSSGYSRGGLGQVSRPQSALDMGMSGTEAPTTSLQVMSRSSTPGVGGPKQSRSMGTLEIKRRPQSVPAMGLRKVESAIEPYSGNQSTDNATAPKMVRPGTAPVLRTLGDSLEVRTRGLL